MQRRDDNLRAIDFEEAPQRAACVAAAETIRAQRDETLAHISADELRISSNVVRCRYDGKWLAQTASDVTNAGRLLRMQPVMPFDLPRLACQLAEAGHAPHIARDLPLCCEQLRRSDNFRQDRPRAQQVDAPLSPFGPMACK